jgi:hypothetical protein
MESEISFSTATPDVKVSLLIVGGAIFVGKAIIGGAAGAAGSWATTRILDNKFPEKK